MNCHKSMRHKSRGKSQRAAEASPHLAEPCFLLGGLARGQQIARLQADLPQLAQYWLCSRSSDGRAEACGSPFKAIGCRLYLAIAQHAAKNTRNKGLVNVTCWAGNLNHPPRCLLCRSPQCLCDNLSHWQDMQKNCLAKERGFESNGKWPLCHSSDRGC